MRQLKNLGSIFDQVLVSGGNFLTIAICAHTLSLSEQGKFTYVFASYLAVLLLNVAGIFQGAAVRAPGQKYKEYCAVLARMQLVQAVMISLFVCGAWWQAGEALGWESNSTEIFLFLGFLILQQLADFDRRTAYIFSSSKRAFISSLFLYPIRITGLLILDPDTVSQVLVIMIFSSVLPALATILLIVRERVVDSWLHYTKEHLKYSRLFIIGAPMGWLWSYIPVFILGTIHGKESAALLASIRGISNIANVFMEQIETKVVVDWARLQHQEDSDAVTHAVSRLYKISLIFWILTMVIIWIFGREIVDMTLGRLYTPYWYLLAIAWLGYGIYFIARIAGIEHRTKGVNKIEFVGNVSGVSVALVAGSLLIPGFGLNGAAWTYVLIAATMLTSQQLLVRYGKIYG